MMALDLPPKASARMNTMIRLLASDKDGEALAAARAMGRLLKAAGKSFHDLADTVVGKGEARRAGGAQRREPPPVYEDWDDEPEPEPEAPSCATLKRSKQFAWARMILERLQIEDHDAAVLSDMTRRMTASDCYYLNKGQVRVLDRLIRRAWRVGLRP